MFIIKKEFAIFYDDSGAQLEVLKIKKKEETFTNDGKTYNVVRKGNNYLKLTDRKIFGLLRYVTFYYDYNINSSEPINKKVVNTPDFTPRMYNIMLKTKVLEDLNKISKDFWSNINWKVILILGICITAIIYFMSGGTV